MVMRSKTKIISMLLILAMVINLLPISAFAKIMDSKAATGVTLTAGDGSTVMVDESWEERFPYGTFAFEESQIVVNEDDGARTIKVYRLGGTRGKAQLTLSLSPVVTETEDGNYSFANAAGINDFTVEVEDTLPIAHYQTYGMAAQPLVTDVPVKVTAVVENPNTLDEDGVTVATYGNSLITAGVEADSYRWQAFRDEIWEDVGEGASLDVENNVIELYDFRCIYTVDGVEYGTESLRGEAYVPLDAGNDEIPDDIDRNPPQTFHTLDLKDGEYDTYEFYMTFAEGEWVKELRITPTEDVLHESVELAAFKIDRAEGGELYDTANTLLFAIEDNEEAQASFFSFQTLSVTADKAAGTAKLTVERTGALQYVTTVDYRTVDGTAKAGTDYAETKGTLYFAGGVSQMSVEIPLINDNVVVEEAGREFTVILENPMGGGEDSEVVEGTAVVSLYNTVESDEKNLATMLSTPDANDVSGQIAVASGAIAPTGGETVFARPVNPGEPGAAEVAFGLPEGEIGALDYNATGGRIVFNRTQFPLAKYWGDYADLGGKGTANTETNNTQALAYKGWDDTSQVKTDSNGYSYRHVENVDGENGKRSNYNTQTFADFDQMFRSVDVTYRADTDKNWSNSFWTTVWIGVTNTAGKPAANMGSLYPEKKVAAGNGGTDSGNPPNYVNTPRTESFKVNTGARGIFFSFGIEDWAWGQTGTPMAKVWIKASAKRAYLNKVLQYVIHTADDDTIKALGDGEAAEVYKSIAPTVSITEGKGGVYSNEKVYIGSTLNLSNPSWSTYSYATQNAPNTGAVYLSGKKGASSLNVVNTGTVANGTATLQIIGRSGKTFATGAASPLSTDDSYSVNVVLNREQRIAVDVSKSVPRLQNDGRTIDTTKISEATAKFWENSGTIRVKGAAPKTAAVTGDYGDIIDFSPQDTSLTESSFTAGVGSAATVLTGNSKVSNIKSVNFGLPEEDQILFNGVLYKGNEDIQIPVSMFGMDTLTFTYYNSEFVSSLSDMTINIARIEHYVDANGNGKLDGYLNQYNQFVLTAVNGRKDVWVENLTEAEYAAGKFTPVYDGNDKTKTNQQFFKFYYNMGPRCLVVPVDGNVTDRAQLLPAFVNAETDPNRRAALSAEMQGYRFITSGIYSQNSSVYNANGDVVITHKAGGNTADGKLMYGAGANATETVDIPLGGDYNPVPATYVYSNGKTIQESKIYDKDKDEAYDGKDYWYISDVKFKRSDWAPDFHGNLLYKFSKPEAIFVSDPLVGENLPVAGLVTKAGNNGAIQDVYKTQDLNNYLGSFNPTDAVMLGVRQQTKTTGEIAGTFEGLSLLSGEIISGEHVIEVDSVANGGFRSIPDASGLRSTVGPGDGAERAADSGNSSNSMPEFNVDMGIELPSLSVGLTDFVTLIIDGSEFGFSIGIPVFSMEKKAENYTASEAKRGNTESKFGAWEKKTPGSEIVENAQKVKDAFTNPGSLIKSEDWQAANNKAKAVDAANKFEKFHNPKADTDKLVKSKGMSFSIAVNVTVMFKWSAPDHAYKFTSAMVFLQFGFQFKQTMRLTICPIVYAYFCVGAQLEVAGGVVNEREVVEKESDALDINRNDMIFSADGGGSTYTNGKGIRTAMNFSTGSASGWEVKTLESASGKKLIAGDKGDAFTFISLSDAVNLYFSGKLKVELKDGADWKNLGYVSSDGSAPVFVMFDEKVDGVADEQEVRITVLDEKAEFDRVVPISKVRNDTFFSGLTLSPSIFLEVGVGIGVEVLKVEVYFKASIGISMSIFTRPNNAATKGTQLRDPSSSSVSLGSAGYAVRSPGDTVSALEDDENDTFSFDSFTFRAGFGVRVVLLLFNFELDVIQFGIDYQKSQVNVGEDGFKKNGWKFAWYVANASHEVGSYGLNDIDQSDRFPDVKITLPSNTFAAQQLFGPEKAQMVMDEIDAMAFDPTNLPSKEFQISGYSSSGDAFRLANGLATGTDYQLLTVDDSNYLLYTISRENPENAVDSNQLVLSKIQNTGGKIGLVNPVDPESSAAYIIVDDDDTGDLDFTASVSGNTINAAWVSYKSKTSVAGTHAPTMPDASVPRPSYISGGNTIYMDGINYKEAAFNAFDPNEAYDMWYAYYDGLADMSAKEKTQLASSAGNTELKTASFTVNVASGFTVPQDISSTTGAGYMFQPQLSDDGKLAFYARSNNYSNEEKSDEKNKAKDFYDASRGNVSTGSNGVSTGEGDPTAAFRYAYTTSMNDVYGKNTQFMFTYKKDDGSLVYTGFTPNGWDGLGMRLINSSMVTLPDNTFYLAYTASVTETEVTSPEVYGDRNVHKLYLQKGSVDTDGNIVLENARMLRQLVDINQNGMNASLLGGLQTIASMNGGGDTTTPDGVYVNTDGTGAKQSIAFEDPYFGSVRFLTGILGSLDGTEENFGESLQFTTLGAEKELFLLFEMNGNSYIIPNSSLASITASGEAGGKGKIIPFFSSTEDDRTRSNVVIGADGDGNISAVYTDTVPGSTNNAIFVSKYDPDTASFGLGRMLAMNYMQVYEDSVAGGWTQEQIEQAFYGKLAGYNKGGMSSFVFSNLDIALGLKKSEASGESSGSGKPATLVILAQGTQTALEEADYIGPGEQNTDGTAKTKVILPKYNNGVLQSTTGYYALSFGVGEKTVGEGKILFPVRDFTPGAILQPSISFKNSGDVPLRGSSTEPITLQLWISSEPDIDGNVSPGGKMLAEWKIEENIAVGQTVSTGYDESFEGAYTSSLPENLTGRKFYFTVSETGKSEDKPNGVENPINYSSLDDKVNGTVRVIEAKPELAVEDVSFSTLEVAGDKVKIGTSMTVTNRGGADAIAPYLQFTYQSGRTMEEVKAGDTGYQQAVYDALDISDGSFEISKQTEITTLDIGTDNERRLGFLRLIGTDTTENEAARVNLKKGYSRTVDGAFWVSKDAYCLATATGSLNIKVTVFDDSADIDSLSSTGTQTSAFSNEYNAGNNTVYTELEPTTFFTAPDRVTVPLGTTMRLSVPAVTTEKVNPLILVKELNVNFDETTENHFGVLYYNMGSGGTGKDGYLVISPSSEGSGVIRVIDCNTGDYTDIAFTVTEAGTGVNIFRDNNIFNWYNAAGQKINPETEASGVWSFQQDVSTWGSATSNPNDLPPYASDLSRALVNGAAFEFTTLAESIDLYFEGTITVSCDASGFTARDYTAAGGDGYVTIVLGDNPNNEARHVTVRVKSLPAAFDRMAEHFAGGRVILPDPGSKAPQIWFSRSLPDTASLFSEDYTSTGFKLTAYVLDENGLANVRLDSGNMGTALESRNANEYDETFRQFDIFVKPTGSAGTFTITATDRTGLTTTVPVLVDWFNTVEPAGTDADKPLSLDTDWIYRDGAGQLLTTIDDGDQLKKGENAFITIDAKVAGAPVDAEVTVQYYNVSIITEEITYTLEQEDVSGAWKLVKTIARTDSAGISVAGYPVVTEEAATESTVLPDNTVTSITDAQWRSVVIDNGEYPIAKNAVYKVTAAKDGVSATKLLFMNRINTDLPGIEAAYVSAAADEGVYIGYQAKKGAASRSGIDRVSVNGYEIFRYSESGAGQNAVSGQFLIKYGGLYEFSAFDAANNENMTTYTADISIQVLGNDFAAIQGSYKSNGKVTLDPTKIIGGIYDNVISNPAVNDYANVYDLALVREVNAVSESSSQFDTFADNLSWQREVVFEDLAAGDYILYVRDANDTPDDSTASDYLIYPLTVANISVGFAAAVSSGSDTGKPLIKVTATGGSGEYEIFAMLRSNSTDLLDADGITTAIADDAEGKLEWEVNGGKYTLNDCETGWYQIAVRDRNVPENFYTEMVSTIQPTGGGNTTGPTVTGPTVVQPQAAYFSEIIERNQQGNVILQNKNCIVLVPAGMLKEGDNLESLLITVPDTLNGSAAGNIVRFVGADGTIRIIPFSLVSDGRVYYVADQYGFYEIVQNVAAFTDTSRHWAGDDIDFVSARGLFGGIGGGKFSPDTSMTRGMFVTVLGRLAGIERGKHTAQRFRDVGIGKWYADYVAWASENGLVSGHGDQMFGPDEDITREQMAVILYKFARFMGLDVDSTGSLDTFSDRGELSGWAEEAVRWAVGIGLMNGRSEDKLGPTGISTRAEVSAMIRRFIEYYLKYTESKEPEL